MPEAYRFNPFPFMGIQMGAARQEPKLGRDTPIFGQSSDCVSVADVIKGYTLGNAEQVGIANEAGSLQVGKFS